MSCYVKHLATNKGQCLVWTFTAVTMCAAPCLCSASTYIESVQADPDIVIIGNRCNTTLQRAVAMSAAIQRKTLEIMELSIRCAMANTVSNGILNYVIFLINCLNKLIFIEKYYSAHQQWLKPCQQKPGVPNAVFGEKT